MVSSSVAMMKKRAIFWSPNMFVGHVQQPNSLVSSSVAIVFNQIPSLLPTLSNTSLFQCRLSIMCEYTKNGKLEAIILVVVPTQLTKLCLQLLHHCLHINQSVVGWAGKLVGYQ